MTPSRAGEILDKLLNVPVVLESTDERALFAYEMFPLLNAAKCEMFGYNTRESFSKLFGDYTVGDFPIMMFENTGSRKRLYHYNYPPATRELSEPISFKQAVGIITGVPLNSIYDKENYDSRATAQHTT